GPTTPTRATTWLAASVDPTEAREGPMGRKPLVTCPGGAVLRTARSAGNGRRARVRAGGKLGPIRTVVRPRHPGREGGGTAKTELREVDRDELVNVEGGTDGDVGPWCGFHPPGSHPHGLGS